MGRGMWNRRGLTPVVSNILMCAVVLVIGASVWGVASGASSIMRSDYFDEVMESVQKIDERFIIENIGYDDTSKTVKIWVSNYGDININITLISVTAGSYVFDDEPKKLVLAGNIERFDVSTEEVSLKGLSISVKGKTERENNAYASILIPP